MTTRKEWLALAARCEAATGPDRKLDEALSFAVYGASGVVQSWTLDKPAPDLVPCPWEPPGNYTASLDAIVALIERELPGWQWSIAKLRPSNGVCTAWLGTSGQVKADTPPLALCAAFCRAMGEVSEATKEG